MASLVADYGESSAESSEESSDAESVEEIKHEQAVSERLPPPTFTDKIKNSVFVNPFLEAENAKFAVLEKHVKMVPQTNGKDHKKICWMFKRGNCRFGKKCKFLHNEETMTVTHGTANASDQKDVNYTQIVSGTSFNDVCNDKNSDEDEPIRKKKRPGLTQGLIPGKKVMAMYKKQKEFSH